LGTPHFAQPLLPVEPDVLFECVKQLGVRDRVIVPASVRVDEYVDMLRHNDVSDQADAESLLQYMRPIAYDAFHGIVVNNVRRRWQEIVQK